MRMKQPKKQRSLPRDQLFQKMSEVISLREKVAQAELVVRVLSPPLVEREKIAEPQQKVTRR
jgi:hypothetical protein